MTEKELQHAEEMFRNPPSAAANNELGLALVAEVRRLSAPAVVIVPAFVDAPPADLEPGSVLFVEPEAPPTPPATPHAKRKAK